MKGVTQMERTAPVRVYLASFLVGSVLLPIQPPKYSSRQSWCLEGPHSPIDQGQSAAGNEVSSTMCGK